MALDMTEDMEDTYYYYNNTSGLNALFGRNTSHVCCLHYSHSLRLLCAIAHIEMS